MLAEILVDWLVLMLGSMLAEMLAEIIVSLLGWMSECVAKKLLGTMLVMLLINYSERKNFDIKRQYRRYKCMCIFLAAAHLKMVEMSVLPLASVILWVLGLMLEWLNFDIILGRCKYTDRSI